MNAGGLGRCRALHDLTDEEREFIARIGTEVNHREGDRIIAEGTQGDCFYILLSGSVEIIKRGHRVASAECGAILGEMALFNQNVRTSEVRALDACRLLAIPAGEFSRLVLQQQTAAVKVMQSLGRLMVQRLQEQDAALAKRVATDDPTLLTALEEFSSLRQRLLSEWALKYHAIGQPGKLGILPSKPVGAAADLSVAYSPGVAEPCVAIRKDADKSYEYTSRGHLVGVVTNGTAVLGLGNIGALAAKPVMEGKAVLFKRFADLDAFDIEVDQQDPDRFIEVVCALAPTFGGINLEDIRAPECFRIEEECKRRLDIPVFHDDQHGTAIVVGAGLLNALELVGKRIEEVRVVFSGAGAAGFATAKFLLLLGVRKENLVLTDKDGVVFRGRGDGNYLDELAAETAARTLAEVLQGADVFVGVSAAGVLKPEMLSGMAEKPIVFALANPVPEIAYPLARRTRSDVMMATGRSDYPNQINNVIAFPFIFRGALDCRARAISDEMKIAATRAVATLAREPVTPEAGLELKLPEFGPEYFIPKPFDRRLLARVACAVAETAMSTGAARVQIDPEEYRRSLERLAQTL